MEFAVVGTQLVVQARSDSRQFDDLIACYEESALIPSSIS